MWKWMSVSIYKENTQLTLKELGSPKNKSKKLDEILEKLIWGTFETQSNIVVDLINPSNCWKESALHS